MEFIDITQDMQGERLVTFIRQSRALPREVESLISQEDALRILDAFSLAFGHAIFRMLQVNLTDPQILKLSVGRAGLRGTVASGLVYVEAACLMCAGRKYLGTTVCPSCEGDGFAPAKRGPA